MRKIALLNFLPKSSNYRRPTKSSHRIPGVLHPTPFSQRRSLAQLRPDQESFPEIWFTSSGPPWRAPAEPGNGAEPRAPDERTLKLGKTLRILQSRLPTLLASPLPQEILSPQISLHLFPSTHPHLPTVSGRVAYYAALWTAPVAWGRVPLVGNVKLIILSERMVRSASPTPSSASPSSSSSTASPERLIVRWKTCGKKPISTIARSAAAAAAGGSAARLPNILSADASKEAEQAFCGLFIFSFDEEGRIMTHTIEHAEEGSNWEKASKVVSVTDWLLGKAKWKEEKELEGLVLGYCEEGGDAQRKVVGGRRRGV